MRVRLSAVVIAISLILSSLLASPSAEAAAPPQLRDLVVAQDPLLTFNPETTQYEATVYRSRDNVDIKPMVDDPAVTVAVNGQTPATNGYVRLPVTVGENSFQVTATKDGQTTTYDLSVTKVDTDFRGRKPVANITATSNKPSAPGADVTNVVDQNPASYWQPATKPATTDDASSDETTKVFLDLNGSYNVSRIQLDTSYAPAGAWQPNIWRNNIDISVSIDDGATWQSVADKANLREDQGDYSVRWEFGQVYENVTDIRLSYVKFDQALQHIRWHGLEVFAGEGGAYPEFDAPTEASTMPAAPSNAEIHRSQELIIRSGLHISTWVPSHGYARGVPTAEEWEDFGRPAPLFYDPPLFNTDFMRQNPNAEWALAKAPWGANDMAQAGEPRNFLTEDMNKYIGNALSFAYGDEGLYSVEENERFKKWFDYSKEQWPHVLVHSNQAHGRGWDSVARMREYTDTANPDILSFDLYPWSWDKNNNPDGQYAYTSGLQPMYDMLNSALIKAQRQVALEGTDGTGRYPILFGQYLDNFDMDLSESQKAMTVHASLAFGMKWIDLFRTEFQFDGSFMFDVDGVPTRGLHDFAALFDEIRNLSPYLTRLSNDWVGFEPGQTMSNGTASTNRIVTGWRMTSVDDAATSVPQYGVKGVDATNVGTINDGLAGDVMVGYFKALPGLTDAELSPTLGDARHAVMVVNGLYGTTLKDGVDNRWGMVRRDNGQFWQTTQDITVSLADHITSVRSIDPATGEETALTISEEAGNRSVTLNNIGGGGARLLLLEGVDEFGLDFIEAEADGNVLAGNARTETLYAQASGSTIGYIGGGNGKVGIKVDGTTAGESDVTLRYFSPAADTRDLRAVCTDSATPPANDAGVQLNLPKASSGSWEDSPALTHTFTCDFAEGTTYVWFWNNTGAAGVDGIWVNLTKAPELDAVDDVTVELGRTVSVTPEFAGDAPLSFSATGLPAGLSVNTATGEVTGLPSVPGTYNVTLTVANLNGSSSQEFTITVTEREGTRLLEAEDTTRNEFVGNARIERLFDEHASGTTVGYLGGGNGKLGIKVDGTSAGATDVTLRYFSPASDNRDLRYACTDSAQAPATSSGTSLNLAKAAGGQNALEFTFSCEFSNGTTYVWLWNDTGAVLVDGIRVPKSTVEPSASPSPSDSPEPSTSPSPSDSPKPSTSPSPSDSPKPSASPSSSVSSPPAEQYIRTAPYTLPGNHDVNGRQWMTTCESYSQTERCRTEIWATVVQIVDGNFVRKSGWAFNNLTYLPYMTRQQWEGNPLGDLAATKEGEFTSAGRQWRTECDTAATGRGACRSYTMTTVYKASAKTGGGYTFSQNNEWVFNNIVMFGGPQKR